MIMINEVTRGIISQYSDESKRWVFANNVLYDLCKEHSRHDEEHIVVAKIWLIGRSYAAAIERRKNADNTSSEDFYYDSVAPIIIRIGSDLDDRIETINKMGQDLSDDEIKLILETHSILTKAFNEITGMDKRSLASKYLHFHCPNHFYIYDSRAAGHIGICVTKEKEMFSRIMTEGFDPAYCDFFLKAYQISQFSKNELNRELSPRDIDNILLPLSR